MSDARTEFATFFEAIWGVRPFTWQCDLLEQVLREGHWPSIIDLPTGAGKTSVLDVAVFALAKRPDTMPRRIAFVVDRRTIVDQTADRATALADALRDALTDGSDTALTRTARRLAELGGGSLPLDVGRLRGGTRSVPDIGEWLRWPDQPAVVVSTVDQFGSRLLFRGYGVSSRMRPVHAGLTGVDTLVLLDEVHLSRPFLETLEQLDRAPLGEAIPRRNQIVSMSATVGATDGERFPPDPAVVLADDVLAQRVLARKDCRLIPPIGRPKQSTETAWAQAAIEMVGQLGLTDGVVGIVVNRVATAVAVHRALRDAGHQSRLVTGRMRAHERAIAHSEATRWAAASGHEDAPGLRLVVATQCIEVGADYSFDGLITEICPLSSLRQRLGRLDRRGEQAASGNFAVALIVSTTTQNLDDDPVYGPALGKTLTALKDAFGFDPFDGGPRSEDLLGLGSGLEAATTHAAVLMPAHLELLSFTDPEPRSPGIDAFLHGFREPNADVSLVWRFDLTTHSPTGPRLCRSEDAEAILAALPAFPEERLDVPVAAVRRWLTGRPPMPVPDVDSPGEEPEIGPATREVWRLDDDGHATAIQPKDLRPGDLLYVPGEWGGLNEGTWDPTWHQSVPDIADEVARQAGWVILRPRDTDAEETGEVADEETASSTLEVFVQRANELCGNRTVTATSSDVVEYGARRAVVRPGRRVPDGRDSINSHLGVPVGLRIHMDGVAATAAAIADRCGLPNSLATDLALVGRLHDLGKADERFQLGLVTDEIELAILPEPLAKSGLSRNRLRSVRQEMRYPSGTRHEFLSVELVRSEPRVLAGAHDPDLVLHLIATHHGRARPWPVVVEDLAPRQVSIVWNGLQLQACSRIGEEAKAEASERFARLIQRYGHHGLAWLEAIFRLADHRRSEDEARNPEVQS